MGYLILLLTAEVSAEFSVVHNEAYQRLLEFSPSEIQSRLLKVLRAYAETTKLLRNQEALHLKPGIQIVWSPQLPGAGAREHRLLQTVAGSSTAGAEVPWVRCPRAFTPRYGKPCITVAV